MLKAGLQANHISLSTAQVEKIEHYLQELNRWNKAYNLTAITDPTAQIYKHIIDSLSVREFIQGKNICDVGTGAGFPGIPLAIFFPEKQFTLVDSSQKKIIFIQQTLIKLKLVNVRATPLRIEDLEAPFDTIISRAFSSIQDFIAKTAHLINQGGQLLAMKGAYPAAELTQITEDFVVKNVRELVIFGLPAKRHLVILEKR